MSIQWRQWVPENITSLQPYFPGKSAKNVSVDSVGNKNEFLKLSSNENPCGPSPKALLAASKMLERLNEYPDATCSDLRCAISKKHDTAQDSIIMSSGSNELIFMIIRTFCVPDRDEIVTHDYAFFSYKIFAQAHNIPCVLAPLNEDLSFNPERFINAFSDKTRVVFLANPNNPTGGYITKTQMDYVVSNLPSQALLVIDEAYYDTAVYSGTRDYALAKDYRNDERIITLRTFSKMYGLAGVRVGYGVMNQDAAHYIDKVRRPFNVSSIAQSMALAAMEDKKHLETSCQISQDGVLQITEAALSKGLHPYPSLGNFVLLKLPCTAQEGYDRFLSQGIIVRPMAMAGLANHVRISVAKPEHMPRVIDALTTLF